jgi:hypothetical protein
MFNAVFEEISVQLLAYRDRVTRFSNLDLFPMNTLKYFQIRLEFAEIIDRKV